jgi:serine/threonine protein phosphatase 1
MLKRLFAARKRPKAPDGMRLYAVGDIHGRLDLLDRLIALIASDAEDGPSNRQIVYLGDYIDRGPASKGVLERLQTPPKGFAAIHLRGNHEQSFLDFLENPSVFSAWQNYGARETLASYGVAAPKFEDEAAYTEVRDHLAAALPLQHLEFLRAMPFSVQFGDYFFAHGGVRPGVALDKQTPEDLMWIREEFLTSIADLGAVIVHGHTPANRPTQQANRIGIDTGAYYSGRLTAAVLDGATCRFLHT